MLNFFIRKIFISSKLAAKIKIIFGYNQYFVPLWPK